MTSFFKALVILDGCFDIDYKYKRSAVDQAEGVTELSTLASVFYSHLEKVLQGVSEKEFKSYFSDKTFDKLIKDYAKKGVTAIPECSKDYPLEFLCIEDRPICLYCQGNVELLKNSKKFSIVGSRKTLPQVLKITEEFSKTLSENGVTIVTGVAGGGDLSAIKGALDSGNLICVSACGADNLFREYTRDYIKKVIDNGLVISEYPPKMVAMPYYYPFRNRLIACLSSGTLVVSGNLKSGTRYTVNYALDYGKEVFAFPYNIGVTSGELCNQIIKDGGFIVTEVLDIATALGYELESKDKILLSQSETVVLSVIKSGKITVDDILAETGLKIYELIPTLTSLEIKNVIVKNGSGEYSAVK
ncbi:MAG: DNA-protecting protein DprA [Clostridia bacterium]|nr:DNA-protecting protein DprA [Clostridia bacterium]